jgi:hypothetical protein
MKKSTEYLVLNLVCMTLSVFCCIVTLISKSNFYDTIFFAAQFSFIGIQWQCLYMQIRTMKIENKGAGKAMLGVVVL